MDEGVKAGELKGPGSHSSSSQSAYTNPAVTILHARKERNSLDQYPPYQLRYPLAMLHDIHLPRTNIRRTGTKSPCDERMDSASRYRHSLVIGICYHKLIWKSIETGPLHCEQHCAVFPPFPHTNGRPKSLFAFSTPNSLPSAPVGPGRLLSVSSVSSVYNASDLPGLSELPELASWFIQVRSLR